MEICFAAQPIDPKSTIIAGCLEDKILTEGAKKLDDKMGGALSRGLAASRFKGSRSQVLGFVSPTGIDAPRVILAGFGKLDELSEARLNGIGGAIYTSLAGTPDETAEVCVECITTSKFSQAEMAAQIALGLRLRSWRCDAFKTKQKPEEKPALKKVTFITSDPEGARNVFASLDAVAEGVFLTRTLVTFPPNLLYPETMALRLKEELEPLGVRIEILEQSELKKLGMGALLGVGMGSIREPRVVVMEWRGGSKDDAPLAFIGKGVTFDSGGISIKPSAGMEDMKYDMAGAGVVGGLMKTLALRKASINAVGVVGLVENMPSGSAQRPSDIVTSMSGQTIEVLNTDAEGRLVLADVLWYTQDRFKPAFMINLATLTGAITVALGDQYAGLFSNNDELAKRISGCGEQVNEKLWRLPLAPEYDRDLDSDIADIKNIGGGRKAGSITAAQFLQRFVNNVPWAHMDIAGMAWTEKPMPTAEKGATAFGVRVLDKLVREYYEDQDRNRG